MEPTPERLRAGGLLDLPSELGEKIIGCMDGVDVVRFAVTSKDAEKTCRGTRRLHGSVPLLQSSRPPQDDLDWEYDVQQSNGAFGLHDMSNRMSYTCHALDDMIGGKDDWLVQMNTINSVLNISLVQPLTGDKVPLPHTQNITNAGTFHKE